MTGENTVIDLKALGDANRINILRLIHENSGISRTDLSQMINLSLSAVSRIVKQLIEEDYILETGLGDSSGGRKPVSLMANPRAGYVIGVDFSKTVVNTAVCDFTGEMIFRNAAVVHDSEYLVSLYESIDKCVQSLEDRSKLLIIYCGIRGQFDGSTGTILYSKTFGWENIPLKQLLLDRYKVPVALDINARLAALGEWSTIYKESYKEMVYITTSWGICAGIISNGALYRGAVGMAGEIGNTLSFNASGVLEEHNLEESCGGQMLIRRAQELWDNPSNTLLKKLSAGEKSKVTVESIVAAVNNGDPFCTQIAQEAAVVLAIGLFNVAYMYNPQIIVIGGLMSEMGEVILAPIRQFLEKRLPAPMYKNLRLELTVLGSRASLVGAAQAAFGLVFSSPINSSDSGENICFDDKRLRSY